MKGARCSKEKGKLGQGKTLGAFFSFLFIKARKDRINFIFGGFDFIAK